MKRVREAQRQIALKALGKTLGSLAVRRLAACRVHLIMLLRRS